MNEQSPSQKSPGDSLDELPDPYRAPAGSLIDETVPFPIETVDAGTRFVGFVIDYLICIGTGFAFGVLVQVIIAMTSSDEEEIRGANNGSDLTYRLIGMLLLFCYYMAFEGFFSRTVGKFVTGSIVVNKSGFPPSFGQLLGRTLARFIPFEPFSFLGSGTRGWHDSLSGTYVVKYRKSGIARDRAARRDPSTDLAEL